MKVSNSKGFTLIELLIVITIIGILAVVIFVAVDPLKRFADARNAQRFSEVNSVLEALLKYQVDNRGYLPKDADGNDLGDPVPAADLDNIRTVVISMKVEEPAGRESREEMKAREYSTWVKCRNLGLDD